MSSISALYALGMLQVVGLPGTVTASEPVRIGLLASREPVALSFAAGARAALAEANMAGGIGGRPLELAQLEPARPWRDGASRIARLVYQFEVSALVGMIDGASAHQAAQVATRARVPLITLSPDANLTRAGAAWVFRGIPDNSAQIRFLVQSTFSSASGKRAVLVVPAGREGRQRKAALLDACRDLGIRVVQTLEQSPQDAGFLPLGQDYDVLFLWLDPEPALEWLETVTSQHLPGVVLGSLRLNHVSFLRPMMIWLEKRPSWAGRLALAALPAQAEQDHWRALGHGLTAALITAVRDAGSDPSGIRDVFAGGRPFGRGTGIFSFDPGGNRRGELAIDVFSTTREHQHGL